MDQPRDPPAPFTNVYPVNRASRLRRHGPVSCVGAPRCSFGYDFAAPPGIRGRGARNETRRTSSTPF